MTLGVLWRAVRLIDLVVSRQCTFLLLPSLKSLVSAPSFERTFKSSRVVAPDLEALKFFHGGYGCFLEDLEVLLQSVSEVEPACD